MPIGRFAEMTRLSIKTLRHYHDVGLLEPAVVDEETGYRYYRLGQANHAEAIRVLRRLDMALPEIADVLDQADDPGQVDQLLRAHQRRLADELDRHQQMLDLLEVLLAGQQPLIRYAVTLESVPARMTASLRLHTDLDAMPGHLADAFTRISEGLVAAGTQPNGPPLVVLHDIIDVDDPGEIEVAIPVPDDVPTITNIPLTRLPGGPVAVTTHRGPYLKLAPAYHAMTDWMVSHGHAPIGSPREFYLNDPRQVDESELLTRVEWPLR